VTPRCECRDCTCAGTTEPIQCHNDADCVVTDGRDQRVLTPGGQLDVAAERETHLCAACLKARSCSCGHAHDQHDEGWECRFEDCGCRDFRAALEEPVQEKGIHATVRQDLHNNACYIGIEWHPAGSRPIYTDKMVWIPIDPELARDLGLLGDNGGLLLVPKPRT
jgi:hypothetical protein